MKPLKLNDLVEELKELGIKEGESVMLHSSLRSLGTVEGGAETVVEAFLQAIGPKIGRAHV